MMDLNSIGTIRTIETVPDIDNIEKEIKFPSRYSVIRQETLHILIQNRKGRLKWYDRNIFDFSTYRPSTKLKAAI